MNTKTAEWGRWTSHCGLIFRTRKELFQHNKTCDSCKEWLKDCQKRSGQTRHNNWTEEDSKRSSETQKKIWSDPQLRKAQSERAIFNNFWKYRSTNPILYESRIAGKMKLDSSWELEVAKRLDSLNVNWYRPHIRIPYLDKDNVEHGYFPDFYVKDFNCFIEVKSPFIANYQNSNNKINYIKEHYPFVKWIESEEDCRNFKLEDLHYEGTPHKDEEDIDYWIRLKEQKTTQKSEVPSKINLEKIDSEKNLLRKKRWNQIQTSNIDFSKFGWVGKIAKIFGISPNKAGKYIERNFPEFYKTCFIRQPVKANI